MILGLVWENTTPSTELPIDFCAGIGPLQLGVVLVLNLLIHFSLNGVNRVIFRLKSSHKNLMIFMWTTYDTSYYTTMQNDEMDLKNYNSITFA